jgi:hypothetical protein
MIFIIDRNGIVRKRVLGQVEIRYLEKAVEDLLGRLLEEVNPIS